MDAEELSTTQIPCRTSGKSMVSQLVVSVGTNVTGTHANNRLQVAIRVGPQRLDGNLLPFIYALRHIPKPSAE